MGLGGSNDEVEQRYHRTINLENQIQSLGYNTVSVWECENPELALRWLKPGPNSKLGKKFVPYPHYIVYDFEAVLRLRNWHETQDTMINCSHIPISVTINDSLTNKPVFIENPNPEQLESL